MMQGTINVLENGGAVPIVDPWVEPYTVIFSFVIFAPHDGWEVNGGGAVERSFFMRQGVYCIAYGVLKMQASSLDDGNFIINHFIPIDFFFWPFGSHGGVGLEGVPFRL